MKIRACLFKKDKLSKVWEPGMWEERKFPAGVVSSYKVGRLDQQLTTLGKSVSDRLRMV